MHPFDSRFELTLCTTRRYRWLFLSARRFSRLCAQCSVTSLVVVTVRADSIVCGYVASAVGTLVTERKSHLSELRVTADVAGCAVEPFYRCRHELIKEHPEGRVARLGCCHFAAPHVRLLPVQRYGTSGVPRFSKTCVQRTVCRLSEH